MRITRIDQIKLKIPYVERVSGYLQKGWNYANRATDDEFAANEKVFRSQWENSVAPVVETSLYRVHTDEGLTGIGEGRGFSDEQLQAYVGKNPFQFIMDDSPGPLQIAFYDLMGQAVGLPMAQMFGPARKQAPVAYWSHSFPPDVLQQEAKIAVEDGYRVHKFKRRAHTDVVAQAQAMADVVPSDYEITIDANCTFGTYQRAIDIGSKLKEIQQVKCLESPINQEDVEGYNEIKAALGYPLAIHFGSPSPVISLPSRAYDFYVVGGWAAGIHRCAHIASAANKPFWLQMGSTGISAVFMVHLAASLSNASLAHVSLFILLEHTLLQEPIRVIDGQVNVPQQPGLGVGIDMDAVEKYRIG